MNFTGTTPFTTHRLEVLALYRELRQYVDVPLDAISVIIWRLEAHHPNEPGRSEQLEIACRLRHGMHPTRHMIGLPRLPRCAFSTDDDEAIMVGRRP